MNSDEFNSLLGIKESYQMPDALIKKLLDKGNNKVFLERVKNMGDMDSDLFIDYFQEEHSDRKNLKQDFTPDCIGNIVAEMIKEKSDVADICAGTGGLTIKAWSKGKVNRVHCEELSTRAVPMLLLNLMVRGIEGEVVNGDSLTGEREKIYKLTKEGEFSQITILDEPEIREVDVVISNPPYSVKWEPKQLENDQRFAYGLAPSAKADYAFILHGISMLKEKGELIAILPHGVLFRGGAEKTIRENIIKENMLASVVGLPENLFLSTQIPTIIMVLEKGRRDGEVLFIDASKDFKKDGNRNIMTADHVERLVWVFKHKEAVNRYSTIVTHQKIDENDYNLNMPRYVDTYIREETKDPVETLKELFGIQREIYDTEKRLFEMLCDMYETNGGGTLELEKAFMNQIITGKQLELPL